jgi:hypothetical protein
MKVSFFSHISPGDQAVSFFDKDVAAAAAAALKASTYPPQRKVILLFSHSFS